MFLFLLFFFHAERPPYLVNVPFDGDDEDDEYVDTDDEDYFDDDADEYADEYATYAAHMAGIRGNEYDGLDEEE